MRIVLISVLLMFYFIPFAAASYAECDVDVGCSDEAADYKDVAVPTIALADFRQLYESDDEYVLIDVRPKSSFDYRHIKGARSLFVAHAKPAEIRAVLPDKEKQIIVYCSNPRCPMSQHAGQLLKFLGYKNVVNFKGGLEEWYLNGLPIGLTPIPENKSAQSDE